MTARIRSRATLARLPDAPEDWSRLWGQQVIKALQQRSTVEGKPLVDGYSLGAFTETRTLNPGTATATDVAHFVATLVSDLLAAGLIGKA